MGNEINFEDYWKRHLSNFGDLQEFFASKVKQNPPLEEIQCWEALNNLAYGTVENLWIIKLHIDKDRSISDILPSFMAIFTMNFPIAEYLLMMMRILGKEDPLTLLDILTKGNKTLVAEQVKKFCSRVKNDKLEADWTVYFKKHIEIRNIYTHAFRLPWWHRKEGPNQFGFPKIIEGTREDINKLIVDFASNPRAWQKRVSESKEHEFISGFELITDRYDESLKMANRLFPIIIAHF